MNASDDENIPGSGRATEPDGEIEGLRLALSVARETNEELRSAAALARAQNEALRIDISLREDELTSLRADHRTTQAVASRTEAELAEANASIEALRSTLAGRDQDLASRDAHIDVTARGIESREQQLAAANKELDRAGEQITLFEGEIQSQRVLLESARQAISLRDDRIAYLQQTLRNLEQLAGGAANTEALPRPGAALAQVPPPLQMQAVSPVIAPTAKPTAPAREAATPQQFAAAPEVQAPVQPAPMQPAQPSDVQPEPSPPASTAPPVEEPAASEPEITEPAPVQEEAPAAAPLAEGAPDVPTDTPYFYRDVPRISTPIFRHWRDSQIEKEHPNEEIVSVDSLFCAPIAEACKAKGDDTVHIWSLSGGDTQAEVRIAALLRDVQIENYLFHILDSQAKKLKKQRTMVVSGLELKDKFDIHEGELENWPEDAPCDFVLADGSISAANHPEALLDRIAKACQGGAKFLITDWIGTSAPLPEAAVSGINELFTGLDEKQRKNKAEGAVEDVFVDRRPGERDSVSSRLIALLEERFTFETRFVGGNLIDTLAGPEFGPNFKVKEADDVAFIDKLSLLDQAIMTAEHLAPRFLVGILQVGDVAEPLLMGSAANS